MPKIKYQFNTKSLQIEKVRLTFRDRLRNFLMICFAGLVFAAVVIFIAYTFFDSPKEKMLKRELAQYELQFKILNNKLSLVEDVITDLQDRDDNIYRVIFEAEPIPAYVREAGTGGSDKYANLEGYKNTELIRSTTQRMDKVLSSLYVQSKSFDEVFEMARNKEEMLACLPAIQPVKNKDLKRISSTYGYRTDPFYKVRKFHEGIDFSAPTGTPIFSTGDGVVKKVRKSRRGYGNNVEIDHGFSYTTFYAHLSKIDVKKGQKVKRGQTIGEVGNTGKSTAPHLHYEVRKNGKAVNPIYYFFNDLTPEEFEELIEISSRPTQSMD